MSCIEETICNVFADLVFDFLLAERKSGPVSRKPNERASKDTRQERRRREIAGCLSSVEEHDRSKRALDKEANDLEIIM